MKIPPTTVNMSSHEDDQDIDREDCHVDVESMDSKASCGGGGGASDSEIDMDDTGSCYDDTEIAIRLVAAQQEISPINPVIVSLNSPPFSLLNSSKSRASTETLPFSISRLLSKPFQHSSSNNHNNNNNNNEDEKRHHKEQEHIFTESDFSKFSAHLGGVPFSANGALYSYPFYPPSHVLRVPPRNGGPLQWPMPSLHPAALAHQAVKDRLAGEDGI